MQKEGEIKCKRGRGKYWRSFTTITRKEERAKRERERKGKKEYKTTGGRKRKRKKKRMQKNPLQKKRK